MIPLSSPDCHEIGTFVFTARTQIHRGWIKSNLGGESPISVVVRLEVEVQTTANNVAVEPRGGGWRRGCEQGAGEVEVVQRADVIAHVAKIVIQVFSFKAPVRHEHLLETTADRPYSKPPRSGKPISVVEKTQVCLTTRT